MRTEKEILKEFRDLGYKIEIDHLLRYTLTYDIDDTLIISKLNKGFSITNYMYFTMKEFKLLQELFKCWGWIDE